MTPYIALLGISRRCGPGPRNAMQGNVFRPHCGGPRPGYPIRGDSEASMGRSICEGLGSWCLGLDRGDEARVVTVREGDAVGFGKITRGSIGGIGGRYAGAL